MSVASAAIAPTFSKTAHEVVRLINRINRHGITQEALPLLHSSLLAEASRLCDQLRDMVEHVAAAGPEEPENRQSWYGEFDPYRGVAASVFGTPDDSEEEELDVLEVDGGRTPPIYQLAEPESASSPYSPTSPVYQLAEPDESASSPSRPASPVYQPSSPVYRPIAITPSPQPMQPVDEPVVGTTAAASAAAPEMRVVEVIDLACDEDVGLVSHETMAVGRGDRRGRKRRLVQSETRVASVPEPKTCPVCLEAVEHATLTPCGHLFCFACISMVLAIGGDGCRCPLCRGSIATDSQLVSLLEA